MTGDVVLHSWSGVRKGPGSVVLNNGRGKSSYGSATYPIQSRTSSSMFDLDTGCCKVAATRSQKVAMPDNIRAKNVRLSILGSRA
jgi:hypothetical protein